MDTKTLINTVAELFVQPTYRERFIHEASKKPSKLMARVCHDIESVFDGRFNGKQLKYVESDACLLFTITGQQSKTKWGEAMQVVQRGGGGILIMDASGKKFFAQSEGFPPPQQFAGSVEGN